MNMNRYLIFVLAAAGLVSAGCDTTLTPGEDSVDPEFESAAGAKLVAIGDINGDGLDDVVSFSDESQQLQIHLRTLLIDSFDTYAIAGGAPLTKAADLAMTDLNGDGRLDIIVLAADTSLAEAGDTGALILLIQGEDPASATSWTQVP
ncbi:MAG: VCBS repeat-containing protein, partial [bacterium]|nr:VCBS repeat-containing protein [bacterium]